MIKSSNDINTSFGQAYHMDQGWCCAVAPQLHTREFNVHFCVLPFVYKTVIQTLRNSVGIQIGNGLVEVFSIFCYKLKSNMTQITISNL